MCKEEIDVDLLENRERTTDPREVYDDVDRLPDWWQNIVQEFEANNLRPYQPSQLADGEVVNEVVESLERRYDVEIRIKALDPTYNGKWAFFIRGTPVITTVHERKPQGYTEYGVTSQEIEEAVRSEIESDE